LALNLKKYIAEKFLNMSLALTKQRGAIWQDAGVLGGRVYSGGISHDADYTELLKAYQGWTYAAASIIARNVARVPLRLYTGEGGELIEIDEHVLLELLRYINPIQTKYELWNLTIIWLELCGNAYWYLPRNNFGAPGEIWPIPPDRMQIVPSKTELIQGYLYRYQGAEIAFDRDEIVHLKYPNPLSIYYGMGTLQAAVYEYDSDLYMKKYSINLFKNDGRPPGVLETEQTLDEGSIKKMQQAWRTIYGGVENAGKIPVLQQGIKYTTIQTQPRELDYVISREYTRDEILGIFGVPASKLGLVKDVNRANAETNELTFQKETIEPRLSLLEASFDKEITPMFDERLLLRFDNPVPTDREFELKQRESNLKNYVISRQEARAEQGYEPDEYGDAPLVPFNLVPIDQLTAGFGQAGYEEVEAEKQFAIKQKEPVPPGKTDRDLLWKAFVKLHTPLQEKFRNRLRGLFKQQKAEVLKNLERTLKSKNVKYDPALVDFILFSQVEWEDKFKDTMKPEFMNIFKAGVEKALAEIAAGDYEFDFRNPNVSKFIREKVMKFSKEVNEGTINMLRSELVAGLEADETMAELATRVTKIFDYNDTWRGLRVARTETTTALNNGVLQAYDQTGLVKKKGWLTARDEAVRDSHFIDGQEVPVDDMFHLNSGNYIAYPGDPAGIAGDIINCRCTMYPVLEDKNE